MGEIILAIFDGDGFRRDLLGLFLRHGELKHPVLVLCLDVLFLHLVADVVAALAGNTALPAKVLGAFLLLPFLFRLVLFRTDGQIAVLQRDLDLVLLKAGHLDRELVVLVRLLNIRSHAVELFIIEHRLEEVLEHIEHITRISLLQIRFHNCYLLWSLPFGGHIYYTAFCFS